MFHRPHSNNLVIDGLRDQREPVTSPAEHIEPATLRKRLTARGFVELTLYGLDRLGVHAPDGSIVPAGHMSIDPDAEFLASACLAALRLNGTTWRHLVMLYGGDFYIEAVSHAQHGALVRGYFRPPLDIPPADGWHPIALDDYLRFWRRCLTQLVDAAYA